jgi:predicted negative regulator of RcsB-dependent stress response
MIPSAVTSAVAFVVTFNVLVAIAGFYAAWQVWQLRQALVQTVEALTISERATYDVLHGAPDGIGQAQMGVHQFRQTYHQMEAQLEQLQRLTQLLTLGMSVWGYRRHLPALKRRATRLR